MSACKLPPLGWYCTRAAGHPGPCAALPDSAAQPDTTASAEGSKRYCSVCGVVEGGYHQGECLYIGVVTAAECRAAQPVQAGEADEHDQAIDLMHKRERDGLEFVCVDGSANVIGIIKAAWRARASLAPVSAQQGAADPEFTSEQIDAAAKEMIRWDYVYGGGERVEVAWEKLGPGYRKQAMSILEAAFAQQGATKAPAAQAAYSLSEYQPGQWWLESLADLWGHGKVDDDTRRAAKVACDFAAAVFASPASTPEAAPAQPSSATAGDLIAECIAAMNRAYPLPITKDLAEAESALALRAAYRHGWIDRGVAAAPTSDVRSTDQQAGAVGEALRELMSIVRIHSEAANENFAWAEMQHAQEVLDNIAAPAAIKQAGAQPAPGSQVDPSMALPSIPNRNTNAEE